MSEDLAIFRLKPLGGNLYKMKFGLTRLPKVVSGVQKLVQNVVIMIMTTPGSDKDDPEVGGGLVRLFRVPLDMAEVGGIQNDLQMAMSRIEDLILDNQEGESLPSDERLQSLGVSEVSLNEATLEWLLVVELVTEAGTTLNLDVSELLAVNNG